MLSPEIELRVDMYNDNGLFLETFTFTEINATLTLKNNVFLPFTLNNILNGSILISNISDINFFNLVLDAGYGGTFTGSTVFQLVNSNGSVQINFINVTAPSGPVGPTGPSGDDEIVFLRKGWNIIGSSFDSTIEDIDSIIIPNTLYQFNPNYCDDTYTNVTMLVANEGYYIKASAAGIIKLVRN